MKFARPTEDPAAAYARRNGHAAAATAGPALVRSGAPTDAATPKADGVPDATGDPSCPKCGGRVWDNRLTKRNPKAPDYKCRDRSCDGVVWPAKDVPGGIGTTRTVPPDEAEDIPF